MKTTKKKEIVVKKGQKKAKLSKDEVMKLLEPSRKKMIYTTLARYQNGAMASIFNESDVTALAEDVAMEVARRVEIFNKNPRGREAVNPKGAYAYFCRAFINRCQKIYEKHARTDTRAGIQTISSDEAMAVASNKNFVSPENDYLLHGEMNFLLTKLKDIDDRINTRLETIALRENRVVKPEEKHHSYTIISKMLEGFEPCEIRDLVGICEVDYARHRKSALELCKEILPYDFNDMVEHFNSPMDLRILTREVNKRKKAKNRVRNYSLASHYYVESKLDQKNNSCQTILYVQINVMEGESKSPDFEPKKIKLMEEKTSQQKAAEVRQRFWNESRNTELKKKVQVIGEKLLKQGALKGA